MSIFDHLFVLIIAVIHPVAGYLSFRRLLQRYRAGEAIDRIHLYRFTTVMQWALFLAALSIWGSHERPWALLGFSWNIGTGFLLGAVLTAAAIAFLATQLRRVNTADDNQLSQFRCELGSLEMILPHDPGELRRMYALSLTAGIVEETLWRGFMIWYLAQFMPLWAAGVASAIGFGLAHAYQGTANVPRVTIVGAVFAGLYLMSGSLWLPMLLHAIADMLQGRMAYGIISRAGATDAGQPGRSTARA